MNIKKWFNNIFNKGTAGGAFSTGTGTARWSARDYANFAREAYIQSFVGYRCIDLIAQSVASVPWKVFIKDDSNKTGRIEQPNHALTRILHRANPGEGFSAFQLGVISFLGIAGNSYVEKLAPETGPNKGLPIELHTHRPDYIKPIIDDNTHQLVGYKLEIEGKEIKTWEIDPLTGQSDLLHIKKFHPLNDIEGLSTVEPAAKSIDTSNEALTWNKKLLENEARPGTLFIFDQALGDDQFKRLQKQLDQKTSGAENAGRNLIVEGAMKDAKPFGFSPMEMDFLKGNWDLVRQICLTYGVPPQILGVPGDSTFANYEQARLFLWESTVFFHLMLLRDEYNNWFFPEDDKTFIDYILDEVPALAPRRKEKWDTVEKSTFLTINEKREQMGLEKTHGGDVILIQASMIPLDMAGVTEEEIDDSESDMDDVVDPEEESAENEGSLELKIV
jgi:HK97 family phage portal protein